MKKYIMLLILIASYMYAKPMTFKAVGNGGNCLGCTWIAAEGEITQDTPYEFEKFVKNRPLYGDALVFNSPGGDLMAGLKLGKLLRKYKVKASIGRTVPDSYVTQDYKWYAIKEDGICVSACAYAFLGAVERHVEENKLGFHQFYDQKALKGFDRKQFSANDRVWDQYLTGVIVNYLQTMDIDTGLYSLISKTPPHKIFFLTRKEIERYEIDTEIKKTTEWTLIAYDKGLVAEFVTRDVFKKKVRIYSTGSKKYYLTVILNGENMKSLYKNLKNVYLTYDLRFNTNGKEKYKVLKTNLYLSKDEKRLSVVFQISKKTALALGNAQQMQLWGYGSDGWDAPRVVWPYFQYISFKNIVGDRRLIEFALKNSI